MKRILLQSFTALLMLQSLDMGAQLNVNGSNTYIYVGDEVLYVSQAVNLNEGKIHLRRNGKLLQADQEDRVNSNGNTGLGSLSVFVMSKPSNKFGYTHYGVPVSSGGAFFDLINSYLAKNEGLIGRAESVLKFQDFTRGNRSNDGETNSDMLRLNTDFISWYAGDGAYAGWKYPFKKSSEILPLGHGLYIKGTSGSDSQTAGETVANKVSDDSAQRLVFRGIPNDGTIKINVKAGNWYNLGNPYPSDLNINKFIADNRDVTGGEILYYTEIKQNTHILNEYTFGYATYKPNAENNGGILTAPDNLYKFISDEVDNEKTGDTVPANLTQQFNTPFVPIGRGFWVEAKVTGQIVFKNSQRSYSKLNSEVQDLYGATNSLLARSAKSSDYGFFKGIISLDGVDYSKISREPVPMLSIKAVNTAGDADAVALLFSDKANDLDYEYDVKDSKDTADLKIYIEGKDNSYRLKYSPFDAKNRYPITIESQSEQVVNFDIDNIINFDKASNVYIYDDFTGVYKDILSEKATFIVPSGVSKGRYYVTFAKGNETLNDEIIAQTAFVVLQNNSEKALTIVNPEGHDVASAQVFDMQGRLILAKNNLGKDSQYRFSTANFADGIYIVKVGTKNGKSVTKKVIVKN